MSLILLRIKINKQFFMYKVISLKNIESQVLMFNNKMFEKVNCVKLSKKNF